MPAAGTESTGVLLRVDELSKSFGAVKAVSEVSFDVMPGEIVGIIGPNGSGKTTLLNLLAGQILPDSGTLLLSGQEFQGRGASWRTRAGIAKAGQIAQPFRELSLIDNVAVGMIYGAHAGRCSVDRARERASEILGTVGFDGDLSRTPAGLPIQLLKRLELARVLATQPSLALLDEIFAGIEARTGHGLLASIQELRAAGLTVIIVEHRIDLLFRVAPRILVMNQGRLIADAGPEEILEDRRVIEAYFGSRYAERLSKTASEAS
jgi:branched-chain amino acid transport system ATP-binding protein